MFLAGASLWAQAVPIAKAVQGMVDDFGTTTTNVNSAKVTFQ
jgi:hypothetical protein